MAIYHVARLNKMIPHSQTQFIEQIKPSKEVSKKHTEFLLQNT
jgi:hypothetical protein